MSLINGVNKTGVITTPYSCLVNNFMFKLQATSQFRPISILMNTRMHTLLKHYLCHKITHIYFSPLSNVLWEKRILNTCT